MLAQDDNHTHCTAQIEREGYRDIMKKLRNILPLVLLILYLGVYEGKVALMRGGHSTPVQVYPRDAALYPAKERQALKDGIPIRDQTHLNDLLRHYLS